MMDGNISPEEHLLNLIKNGKGRIKEVSSELPKVENPVMDALVSAGKTPIVAAKKTKKIKKKGFTLVNRILLLCFVVALVYTAVGFSYPFKAKDRIGKSAAIAVKEGIAEDIISQTQPISYYADTVNKRQMFKIFEAPKKIAEQQKPKVTLQQLLAGYTFVGIIFGDVPQAIIEDKKSGQSFYLTAGQMLGEIKIEKIEQGIVSVSLGDDAMDINI